MNQGPTLPLKRAYHCLVMPKTVNTPLLIGGYMGNDVDLADTHSFDFEEKKWTEQASLAQSKDGAFCEVLKVNDIEIVVVSGGYDNANYFILDGTEFLFIENGQIATNWSPGPTMPEKLSFGASVVSLDRSRLYIAGGNNVFATQSNAIYQMQCLTLQDCQWTKWDQTLLHKAQSPLAIVISKPTYICQTPSGIHFNDWHAFEYIFT